MVFSFILINNKWFWFELSRSGNCFPKLDYRDKFENEYSTTKKHDDNNRWNSISVTMTIVIRLRIRSNFYIWVWWKKNLRFLFSSYGGGRSRETHNQILVHRWNFLELFDEWNVEIWLVSNRHFYPILK